MLRKQYQTYSTITLVEMYTMRIALVNEMAARVTSTNHKARLRWTHSTGYPEDV